MKQKFLRGHRVRISKEYIAYPNHEAIVEYSYSDVYSFKSKDNNQYSLLIFIVNSKPIRCSWFDDTILSLVSDDRDEGEKLLQEAKRNDPRPTTPA